MGMISLTNIEFNQLSSEAQKEILTLLGIEFEFETDDEFASKLNSKMAREFMMHLSPKSKLVLQKIIDFGKAGFWLDELETIIQIELEEDIGGVWGGLTRRVRTVTGIEDAELFHWTWFENEDRTYGKLHQTTYHNLQKLLSNS